VRYPTDGPGGARGSLGPLVGSPIGPPGDRGGCGSRVGPRMGPDGVRGSLDEVGGAVSSLGSAIRTPGSRGCAGDPSVDPYVGKSSWGSAWGSPVALSRSRGGLRSVGSPRVGARAPGVPWRTVVTTVRRQVFQTTQPDVATAGTHGGTWWSVDVDGHSGMTSRQTQPSPRPFTSTQVTVLAELFRQEGGGKFTNGLRSGHSRLLKQMLHMAKVIWQRPHLWMKAGLSLQSSPQAGRRSVQPCLHN